MEDLQTRLRRLESAKLPPAGKLDPTFVRNLFAVYGEGDEDEREAAAERTMRLVPTYRYGGTSRTRPPLPSINWMVGKPPFPIDMDACDTLLSEACRPMDDPRTGM